MKFSKILCAALVVPSLFVSGCFKDDDGDDEQIEYVEVEKNEATTYLNQLKEAEKLEMNGYEFSVTIAIPSFSGEGAAEQSGEENTSEEELWPDISDENVWNKISVNGQVSVGSSIEAKYTITEGADVKEAYIKNNVMYANTVDGKFKTEIDADSVLEELATSSTLPSVDALLDQIDMITKSEGGLTFKKAESKGKLYYHIEGVATINETNEFGTVNMEMPIDLHMTFENNQLVAYKYKTLALFMYIEQDVNIMTTSIEFPSDLNSYILNDDYFEEE